MCTVFDEIARESEAVGEAKGEAKGEVRGRAFGIIETGLEFGLSESDILSRLQKNWMCHYRWHRNTSQCLESRQFNMAFMGTLVLVAGVPFHMAGTDGCLHPKVLNPLILLGLWAFLPLKNGKKPYNNINKLFYLTIKIRLVKKIDIHIS